MSPSSKHCNSKFDFERELEAVVSYKLSDQSIALARKSLQAFYGEDGDSFLQRRGASDFWTENDIHDLFGEGAVEELRQFGFTPVNSLYSKEQIATWQSAKKTAIEQRNQTRTLVVDFERMTLQYGDQGPFEIDGTIKFRLLERLAHRPGIYVHLDTLKQEVWRYEYVDDDVVNRQARFARQALRNMGIHNATLKTQMKSWALLLG